MKKVFLYLMVAFLLASGVYHFINPVLYLSIMPSWLPYKELLNQLAGISEIGLALLLISTKTRTFASNMIVLMFISFFLVHVGHLFEPPIISIDGKVITDFRGEMYNGLFVRILLQFGLIYWAYKIR
jgi:uncharacterized membrane protein